MMRDLGPGMDPADYVDYYRTDMSSDMMDSGRYLSTKPSSDVNIEVTSITISSSRRLFIGAFHPLYDLRCQATPKTIKVPLMTTLEYNVLEELSQFCPREIKFRASKPFLYEFTDKGFKELDNSYLKWDASRGKLTIAPDKLTQKTKCLAPQEGEYTDNCMRQTVNLPYTFRGEDFVYLVRLLIDVDCKQAPSEIFKETKQRLL